MIDRIMSKVKIQTKVLVLVTPFVLCICAVGFTGYLASRLLEGRMEVSNSVLQSLNGFKHVYASMSGFLMSPSKESHDQASRDAGEQLALLKETTERLRAGNDVALLDEAIAQSKTIPDKIEAIWALHSKQQTIMAEVAQGSATLLDLQGQIGKRAFALVAAGKTKENANKANLKNSLAVNTAAELVSKLVADYTAATDPAEKLKIVSRYVADITKQATSLARVLPKDMQPVVEAFQKQATAMADRAMAQDKVQAIASTEADLPVLQKLTQDVKLATDAMMRRSVLDLAASDQEIAKAEAVGNKLRGIVNNNNEIRIVFAQLLANPSDTGVKDADQALSMYGMEVGRLAALVKDDSFFTEMPAKVKPVLDAMEASAKVIVSNAAEQRRQFAEAARQIDATWTLLSQFADMQRQNAGVERQQANRISLGAVLVGVFVALLAGAALVLTLKGPIGQITSAMRRLAEGVLDTAIAGESRPDEIGDMARALAVFKDNAVARLRMEREAEATRSEVEGERQRNDAERRQAAEHLDAAIEALGQALARLSKGELDFTIDRPFADHLDRLRRDFNLSIAGLRSTLSEVSHTSGQIFENGQQMAEAVNDLAKRTEQQAASLEETAAAVDEISVTVKTASARAGTALRLVEDAKRGAENSAGVVRNAVSAMDRIREASAKITHIVEVIDGIAFQTNLLALNAGVEAARAGEAGKGFAVVAQEVRELAQRSAKAAKEIGGLIANTVHEVAVGSDYVGETGTALSGIASEIVEIYAQVEQIAASAQEQSATLQSINGSVNDIDRMTQQNAAMVEETSAATRQLADEATRLMGLIDRFRLGETGRSQASTIDYGAAA